MLRSGEFEKLTPDDAESAPIVGDTEIDGDTAVDTETRGENVEVVTVDTDTDGNDVLDEKSDKVGDADKEAQDADAESVAID